MILCIIAVSAVLCSPQGQASVLPSEILEDTVWSPNREPYVIEGTLTVQSGATLKVLAGVVVRFKQKARLRIGWKTPGSLIVEGSLSNPVTFTSDSPSPEPGDWAGLQVLGASSRIRINGLRIKWAGAKAQGVDDKPALRIGPGVASEITNCLIQNAAAHGIEIDSDEPLMFDGNEITGCRGSAIMVSANAAGGISANNKFKGNGLDAIVVGELGIPVLDRSSTWSHANSPYLIRGELSVESPKKAVTLTIHPGVRVLFGPDAALTIGWNFPADLVARGEPDRPIRFEPIDKQGKPGLWEGVILGYTGEATILEQCRFLEGGITSGMLVLEEGSRATVRNCSFRHSANWGIFVARGAKAVIESCAFDKNAKGGIGHGRLSYRISRRPRNVVAINRRFPIAPGGE